MPTGAGRLLRVPTPQEGGLSNTTTAVGVSKGGGGTSEGEGAEGGSDQESGVD